MYSIKNAVYVAVMQVGVIVIGVLGAGIWFKLAKMGGMPPQLPTIFLMTHAFNFFVIPLVWIIVTSFLNQRPTVSDGAKTLALCCGILMLMGLVVLVLYADVRPLFSIMWNMGGDGER